MYIILGATGHVGGATARALLRAQQAVTVVTRDAQKAHALRSAGAQVAEVDVRDASALRALFRRGKRALLLNPPADPSSDTDAVERSTVRSLLAALDGSGLEKVVAQSTYGAQPGEARGDLTVLYELEQGLAAQSIPVTVQRAAYYMSNFDGLLESVRAEGVLPSFFPAELKLPMVAPVDLGESAARWLLEPITSVGTQHVEGPEHYSTADVASAFSAALARPVRVAVVPRDAWERTFQSFGFSASAARSYARMTATVVDRAYTLPEAPVRGTTTLHRYIEGLVHPHG